MNLKVEIGDGILNVVCSFTSKWMSGTNECCSRLDEVDLDGHVGEDKKTRKNGHTV